MERSVTSLTYKGAVSEAIVEAQKQKKLFLVYISGEDEISARLEQSTWVDDCVAESIPKYCIFLHLIQGSMDALQFSSIYPQKSVPCITAVGYNGVMLWQHEGYIDVANFVGSIEKAWASIHFQETAVTFLTAALASKKPEPLNSNSHDVPRGTISALDIASTSATKSTEGLEGRHSNDSKLPVEHMVTDPIDDDKDIMPGLETSSLNDDVNTKGEEQTNSKSNIRDVTKDTDASIAPNEAHALDKSDAKPSAVPAEKATVVTSFEEGKAKNEEVAEPSECSNVTKSDDIYLNIRLPNGRSLQRSFISADTLKAVKNYVDENQVSGFGSYDLAIPYPRKVFNEQDMNSVLSDLGFASRQALIVVPHRQVTRPQSVTSLSHDSQNIASMINSTDDSGGYFAFVKRALSYINPLSYLGGNANSSNSEPVPSDSYQQYRPNNAFESRHSVQNPQNPPVTGEMRRRTSRPFGSNIHTLRHDEDDFQSRDRNTFWNGNSTQFGGDNK